MARVDLNERKQLAINLVEAVDDAILETKDVGLQVVSEKGYYDMFNKAIANIEKILADFFTENLTPLVKEKNVKENESVQARSESVD